LCMSNVNNLLELAIVRIASYYLSFGSFMWIWRIVGYLLVGRNLLNLTMLLIGFGGLILIRFVIVIPNRITNVLVLGIRFM